MFLFLLNFLSFVVLERPGGIKNWKSKALNYKEGLSGFRYWRLESNRKKMFQNVNVITIACVCDDHDAWSLVKISVK